MKTPPPAVQERERLAFFIRECAWTIDDDGPAPDLTALPLSDEELQLASMILAAGYRASPPPAGQGEAMRALEQIAAEQKVYKGHGDFDVIPALDADEAQALARKTLIALRAQAKEASDG